MRRWSKFWALILGVLFTGTSLAVLGLALKQEPEFFRRDDITLPQPNDPELASIAQTKFLELQNALDQPNAAAGEWLIGLNMAEINAFLREDPHNWNVVLPAIAPLNQPCVDMVGNTMTVGMRYGTGFWSTVLWMEWRCWLIADEPNLVALELVSLRAGAVPLTKSWMMDRLSKAAVAMGAELSWYRGEEHPVGVLRLRPNRSQPDLLLRVFTLTDGQINIGGKGLIGS